MLHAKNLGRPSMVAVAPACLVDVRPAESLDADGSGYMIAVG